MGFVGKEHFKQTNIVENHCESCKSESLCHCSHWKQDGTGHYSSAEKEILMTIGRRERNQLFGNSVCTHKEEESEEEGEEGEEEESEEESITE